MGRSTNKKFKHNLSDAEIRSILTDEMKAQGLVFENDDLPLRLNGKTHYVRVSNRSRLKKNHRSGWYAGHLGDFPCAKFGWLHGEQPIYKWSLYEHLKGQEGGVEYVSLTEEEIAEKSKQEEREERRRKREELDRFNFAKALATIEWVRSLELRNHPYLISKRFSVEECKPYVRIYNPTNYTNKEVEAILNEHFPEYNKPLNIRKLINYQIEHIKYRGFNLIMVGKLIDGTPQLLQLIFDKKSKAGKNKHFPKSLNKQNTFLTVGANLNESTSNVVICEGWATAMSILRFTGGEIPILVAWDSGNMNSVAKVVRKHYPDCRIYSASDNDHTKPLKENAGIKGGLKTCFAVGASLVLPPFDSNDPTQAELSDWNDIDLNNPPPVSSQLFYDAFMNAQHIEAEYSPNIPLISDDQYFDDSEVFATLDYSEKFQQTCVAIMSLIHKGLQHCGYTKDEQLLMYAQEHARAVERIKEAGFDGVKRIYDTNIDLQISDMFSTFTYKLFTSENNIMADGKLFIPFLKDIRAKQSLLPNESILKVVRDTIAVKYGEEMATACIMMYLKQGNYFIRSKEDWHNALIKRINLSHPTINLSILIPLVINQLEVNYWLHPTKSLREENAVAVILDQYNEYLITDEPNSEITIQQTSKLKYIYAANHKLLVENCEKNQDFLQRITQRFNETEKIDITQFINKPS